MMNLKRRLWSSVILSAIITPFVTATFTHSLEYSMIDVVSFSLAFFLFSTGLLFLVFSWQDMFHFGVPNPFKHMFILSASTLFLSLAATVESLRKGIVLYFSLSMVVLFFLTAIKSRRLWLQYPTGFGGKKMRGELSRINKAWITLYFCGLLSFLFLVVYYLGWYPA